MKEKSNEDLELIRKLSQLMTKEKITKLKFIELIKYTLGLFGIDIIEKKEFYSGKNNSKRFKLKYNGICGCEIELNLKNFETDSIFE